jgi:hypothetical protein
MASRAGAGACPCDGFVISPTRRPGGRVLNIRRLKYRAGVVRGAGFMRLMAPVAAICSYDGKPSPLLRRAGLWVCWPAQIYDGEYHNNGQ